MKDPGRIDPIVQWKLETRLLFHFVDRVPTCHAAAFHRAACLADAGTREGQRRSLLEPWLNSRHREP